MSPSSLARRRRKLMRFGSVTTVLLRTHVNRQLANGWRGFAALGSLAFVAMRIALPAVLKALAYSGSAATGAVVLGATALATLRANPKGAVVALFFCGVLAYYRFKYDGGPNGPRANKPPPTTPPASSTSTA